jgi:hypothetical protein
MLAMWRANPAGDGHPPRPYAVGRVGVWLLCPRQRRLDGDRLRADRLQVGHEPGQQPVVLGQVVAKRATQPQVLLGGLR